jgi:hypothetical protein
MRADETGAASDQYAQDPSPFACRPRRKKPGKKEISDSCLPVFLILIKFYRPTHLTSALRNLKIELSFDPAIKILAQRWRHWRRHLLFVCWSKFIGEYTMFALLLGWSWTGHGQLTELALALAIAKLLPMGKVFILKRLGQIAQLKSIVKEAAFGALKSTLGLGGNLFKSAVEDAAASRVPQLAKSKQEITTLLSKLDNHPAGLNEQELVRLFGDLPSRVQEEDLHIGNIPNVGQYLEKDSQMRHFMRSLKSTTFQEAYQKSTGYISNHLTLAWKGMHNAVMHQKKWYDFVADSTMTDFDEGVAHLVSALHTIEDSYAPGHVSRDQLTGRIIDIHVWDEANKKGTNGMPGHEALDNPNTRQSVAFFNLARQATGEMILCVLANLDQNQGVWQNRLANNMNKYFAIKPGK